MRICPACNRTFTDETRFCPQDGSKVISTLSHHEASLAAALAERFRIVGRLGGGGMGTVFLAEQVAFWNRYVALKVLNPRFLADPQFLQHFQNEAALAGAIRHANVVTIYDFGQGQDGTPYIAMEYLEGETLGQALKSKHRLPLIESAQILRQAAGGLNAAHNIGIIHRDVTPGNIFLIPGDYGEKVVKIVDFGIAKLRESAAPATAGFVLGTPAYMSPEQASGLRSSDLDRRSDVYSLGVVVYQMLTGRVPFESDTPLGYLHKHLHEDPPPFSTVRSDLPDLSRVEKAVRKALEKDREHRYASALDFAREFAAGASGAPSEAIPSPFPETPIVPGTEPAVPVPLPTTLVVWPSEPLGATARIGVGLAPGVERENPVDGLKYVWIPPGTFMMGCSPGDSDSCEDEKPPHQVTITKGFWLTQTQVTVGAYKRFVSATGRQMPPPPRFNSGWANTAMPVVNVSWPEAAEYCTWAGGRLPTEAEWEYAARGGTVEARHGGLDEIAWYDSNSKGRAHEVAQKRPNGFGLFDMVGNVWEWVNDFYDEDYYRFSPSQDPRGPASGRRRVLRGGSSFNSHRDARVSSRIRRPPGVVVWYFGLRCVREVLDHP